MPREASPPDMALEVAGAGDPGPRDPLRSLALALLDLARQELAESRAEAHPAGPRPPPDRKNIRAGGE